MSFTTDPMQKQRQILEKLMNNIDKPVIIPEKMKDRAPPKPPEFVRNIMGSSAGAGSAEFHLYRNLRKKDMIRQEIMNTEIKKEKMEQEYNDMIEKYRKEEESKTMKRRAKRLKRKMKVKAAKGKKKSGSGTGDDPVKGGENQSTSPDDDSQAEEDQDGDQQHPIATPFNVIKPGMTDLPQHTHTANDTLHSKSIENGNDLTI